MSSVPAFSERGALDAPGPTAVLADAAGAAGALPERAHTDDARRLVGTLARVHDHSRRALLAARRGATTGEGAGLADLDLRQVLVGPATVVVHPRGIDVDEPRAAVDGRPVGAALFDIAIAALERGPLHLVLPPIERRSEAEWWDAVLADLERRVRAPYASITVTVPTGATLGASEAGAIHDALRDRVVGPR